MNNLLDKICSEKRALVAELSSKTSFQEIDSLARSAPPPRGFERSLHNRLANGEIGLITEMKKASPSAGLLQPDYSPAQIARSYEEAGADCLSVLTDTNYFQGRNDDLAAARQACSLPALRKDFMVDPWQIAESRALGADCILIIMAAVDDAMAHTLHNAACDYGMDILIESHNEEELHRALQLPSGMIGINNRNLQTLQIDLATTEKLAPLVPSNRLLVCESGIKDNADINRMRAANAHCFLIGESILKQANHESAVKNLRG